MDGIDCTTGPDPGPGPGPDRDLDPELYPMESTATAVDAKGAVVEVVVVVGFFKGEEEEEAVKEVAVVPTMVVVTIAGRGKEGGGEGEMGTMVKPGASVSDSLLSVVVAAVGDPLPLPLPPPLPGATPEP